MNISRLMIEEPLFPLNPSCISREGFIFADDAMAGNDDSNRISMVRTTDSSYCLRVFYHDCLFEIVSGFTIGNHSKCLPGFLLEICSVNLEWNGENFPSSCEIF